MFILHSVQECTKSITLFVRFVFSGFCTRTKDDLKDIINNKNKKIY